MKILIASDLHGSYYSLRKMMEYIKKNDIERVLFLGDMLYHGPRNDLPFEYNPKECIRVLNENKDLFTCVRGNCEAEVDQMVLDFPVLEEERKIELDGIEFYMTHGHHHNNKMPLETTGGSVVLFGHTHVPLFECVEGSYYINPGSLSIPKEGSVKGFMVYENRSFKWMDLDGNEKEIETI